MSHIRFRWMVPVLLFFLFGLQASVSSQIHQTDDLNINRARLLSYSIKSQLDTYHYSHKKIDDSLSVAAFDLYLKQLDFQKRFLLQADVARLKSYTRLIDDEMNSGQVELPKLAAAIMVDRIGKVQVMMQEILAGNFDLNRVEYLEADEKKIDYCFNDSQLRERWRKLLKYQVESDYLNLLEDQASAKANPEKQTELNLGAGDVMVNDSTASGADLLVKARNNVLKTQENLFSRIRNEEEWDYYDRYFDAVARAFDPHSNYLPPSIKEDFDISMRGSLEGIGATLREEDGFIKVVRIIPGSAAYRQGRLQAEDIILKVGEGAAEPVDLTNMRIRDAVSYIRGKKGTEVRLHVRKDDGKMVIIPIIRDVVQIEETFVKSAVLEGEDGSRYGYLKIPTFYRDFGNGDGGRNSTDDVDKELKKLHAEHIRGLVLDLSNNGGGALTDAVSIAGLFIKTGPVVQVKSSNGSIKLLDDPDPSISYEGPIVVLVNKFSASASEILAGALQDYNRALIVGSEHTHGKGTVQTVIDLDSVLPLFGMDMFKPLGALKVTIQKFYRISGGSTQYRGIVPDIILPDRFRYLQSGEEHLDFSLPWDTVAPTPFTPWRQKPLDLTLLKVKSEKRVQQDQDFVKIVHLADLAGERREKSQQSLLLKDLERERQEFSADMDDEGENMHEDFGSDPHRKPDNDSSWSEEKKYEHWRKTIAGNPYVKEAMRLLVDMI